MSRVQPTGIRDRSPIRDSEETLNIAYVSNVVYPFITGGVEKRIEEIGTRLVKQGHSVTIYCRRWWGEPQEILRNGIRFRGVAPPRELYTNGRRSISEAISFSKACLGPLRTHLDEHDLLDISVFPYFPVLAGSISTLGKKTPIVTTWHEVWGKYWLEYLGSLGICGMIIELLAAHTPQNPVAVSNHTAKKLTRLGVNQDRIRVIPNGIDIDEIKSTSFSEDKYDVLFAGRLVEHKNVDTAIKVFDRLANKHDITFGIIGDGPERKRLEQLAASTAASDRIQFLGRLNKHSEVLSYMKAADIFLSPSTREGFGNTFVEAMAAGCTVVGIDTKESAAQEVISKGGFTVPFDEIEIEQCLSQVLNGKQPPVDPKVRARNYSWENIYKSTELFYQSLV